MVLQAVESHIVLDLIEKECNNHCDCINFICPILCIHNENNVLTNDELIIVRDF